MTLSPDFSKFFLVEGDLLAEAWHLKFVSAGPDPEVMGVEGTVTVTVTVIDSDGQQTTVAARRRCRMLGI